ncbi:nitrilase-related carbon-nitrogen hydrolase [Streptomyces sp. NP160]|uniref:nitrilase-related carbon-nitrogen hydrolase n=1 Tax=Streptomyces sp. NP160 TaxID=2586637 RepID=UPI00214B6FE3|nr:nitrilase-related carbon-nitrogen hydrolase [Streptomyces sp. NP160]
MSLPLPSQPTAADRSLHRPPATTARVAAVQLAPALLDLPGNTRRTTTAIADALDAGADVVVLPELATSGYGLADAAEARSVAVRADSAVLDGWAAACRRRPGAVVVGGFCELGEDGRVHNSAAVVDGSGVRAVYRKAHLWDAERLVFTPGDAAPPVVETAHGRISTVICYDLGFPEWVRTATLAGADLLAVPTNWALGPRPAGERPIGQVVAMAAARAGHLAVVCCDRTGRERGVDWTEGTCVVGADGWVLAEAGPGTATAWADVDLRASRNRRAGALGDLLGDRRPELYAAVSAPRVHLPGQRDAAAAVC